MKMILRIWKRPVSGNVKKESMIFKKLMKMNVGEIVLKSFNSFLL